MIEAIRAGDDWDLQDDAVVVRNEGRFLRCEIAYPTNFDVVPALRPRLKLEITLAPPALPTQERSLASFVADARNEEPEVARIACVAPAETAADKLSALTWRVLDPEHCRDRTLVRHLHDLAILEPHALEHQGFPELLTDLMERDAPRGTVAADVAAHDAIERLELALDVFGTDAEHEANYDGFVREMCYGPETETPTFREALDAIRRLGQHLH